jgi:hypothetical protein
MSVLPKALLEVKALPLAVIVVAAYFLYRGVFALRDILFARTAGTYVNQEQNAAIVQAPIDPMHVVIVLTCIVGGGYGVSWGMSKLR